MSKPYKEYEPKWITEAPNPRSFRSIMKWGDPARYKAPKEGLYKLIKILVVRLMFQKPDIVYMSMRNRFR